MSIRRASGRSWLLLACATAIVITAAAADESRAPGVLAVGLAPDEGPAAARLPLVRASWEIDVYGGMASGTLTQEYANDTEETRTVRWGATLDPALELVLLEQEDGGRIGELEFERVKEVRARETTAIRSMPFEVSAEQPAWIRSSVRTPLSLEGRTFTLTLPAVLDGGAATAAGDTAAKRVATNGKPQGPGLRIVINVHRDEPLLLARSRTHDILVDYVGDRTIIETTRSEVRADRPFELEFAVNPEDEATPAAFLRGREDGRGSVEALLLPPERPAEQTVRPKQLLFVIDTSGSMAHEEKIAQARRAVVSCVEKLNPDDSFNIVEFDTDFTIMRPEPVDAASLDREAVERWLAQWRADGGTKLLPALGATLDQPEDPERHRMIVVVTDGILADEKEVLTLLEDRLGAGRLFVVGTGRQHRQETLLRLAEYGRGAATFAGDESMLESAVNDLFAAISSPLGWDVELRLDGAEIDEISPSRLPDLYAGRPVRVLAWYRGDDPTGLRLELSTVEGKQVYDVKLPPRLP
jgi:Ca-activated chloride channel family protein